MSLVRTLYLYLFSFIGLIVTVVGAIGLLNLGLKVFVFTQADKDMYSGYQSCAPEAINKFPSPAVQPATTTATSSQVCLTAQEKADMDQWIASYKDLQEQNKNVDPLTARRQRDLATNLAMIIIGLPLYIFHWATIKRELKNEKEGKA